MATENKNTLAFQNLIWELPTDQHIQIIIQQFLTAKRSEGVSIKTLAIYSYELNRFEAWLAVRGVTTLAEIIAHHYRAYLAERLEKVKSSTAHISFRSLRTFDYWIEREYEGQYVSPFHRKIKPPKIVDVVRSTVDTITFVRLLGAINKKSQNRLRDESILLTLFDSGLRRNELINLDISDLDLNTGKLRVRLGKGRKSRECYVGRDTLRKVRAYLRERGNLRSDEPLFATCTGERFKEWGLRGILTRLEREVGVKVHGWHSLRRGFATAFMANGGDLVTLSRLLGHSSVSVTQLYIQQSADELQAEHRHNSPVDGLRRRGGAR